MTVFRKICVCVVCVAMCYLLPLALRPLGLYTLISPITIPVIICAISCGPGYGFTCAILGPILCSLLTGTPDMPDLVPMMVELSVYAFLGGLIMRAMKTGSLFINTLLTLIPTILVGRVAAILAVGIFYLFGILGVETFSLSALASRYFVDAIPTISLQLILITLLTATLTEEKLLKF